MNLEFYCHSNLPGFQRCRKLGVPFFLVTPPLLIIIAIRLLLTPHKRNNPVAQLGGLIWKRNQFCRGWLITGDTGSGKTSSGINQLAHQVFQNEPNWGGLCIDEKGVYWETLSAMANHYERETDLIHLQIRPDETDPDWRPPHRFNLTGDRSIPFSTYAKYVVDAATIWDRPGTRGFSRIRPRRTLPTHLNCLRNCNSR